MVRLVLSSAVLLLTFSAPAAATSFKFDTFPFAGSLALTTPGRQIVAGETFINFSIAADVFSLEAAVFGVTSPIVLANDLASNLPISGLNVVVLRSFDNDANPATPFGAGNAADLIAAQITTSGPGFFIYFNSGLDLARLVYSTDLNDNTADLRILFRLTNLAGQAGRDAIPTFTAANFEVTQTVPEPSTAVMLTTAGALLAARFARRRARKLA
jgi:hypothetical protein